MELNDHGTNLTLKRAHEPIDNKKGARAPFYSANANCVKTLKTRTQPSTPQNLHPDLDA